MTVEVIPAPADWLTSSGQSIWQTPNPGAKRPSQCGGGMALTVVHDEMLRGSSRGRASQHFWTQVRRLA
jgi:hypothetical protein